MADRISARSACWRIMRKCRNSTKRPSSSICAKNWNTSWWKLTITRAPAFACCANEVGGRATFFVDSLRNLKLDEYEPIIHFRSEDGVISRLDKLVEFRDPLGPAAKQFLPRLRSGYLTDTPSPRKNWRASIRSTRSSRRKAPATRAAWSPAARPDEAGPLGMKRELRAVDAELMHLEQRSRRDSGRTGNHHRGTARHRAGARGIDGAAARSGAQRSLPRSTATSRCKAIWRGWAWT